jgi:hypothetical protein
MRTGFSDNVGQADQAAADDTPHTDKAAIR